MQDYIQEWFTQAGLQITPFQQSLVVIAIIVVTSAVIHLLLHRVISKLVEQLARKSRRAWRQILFEGKLFSRLAYSVQGVIISVQAGLWLNPEYFFYGWIQTLAQIWIALFVTLTLFSLVDALSQITSGNSRTKSLPLNGLLQAVKLFFSIVAVIIIVSIAIDRSPMLIISGLGAMTAVLLLVFKDPILGFVAGIQLSANKMLKRGDWLEMPSYGADGDVLEIGLTTVKVQNWDKTITSIPTYALITDSFKNWQGMSDSGGRRIMRAVYIDVNSVKFMDQPLTEQLTNAELLAPYLEQKSSEIEDFNHTNKVNMKTPLKGRRMTNLGTFRAYLLNYITNHADIHKDMTIIVRQLAADSKGIPLQIYAFTNTTDWAVYEEIQGDIFDHIYAVIESFELQIYQSPSSTDVRSILSDTKALTNDLTD